jgi:hypothetical protein
MTLRGKTMALISMRQMLDHAAEFGYGVPAFNVNNLEQMRAIMEGRTLFASPDFSGDRRVPTHSGVYAPRSRHQP